MKRLFLSIIAIVAISASSVFATAYDAYEIGQLVDENNMRADLGGSLGVLFGNDTFRGAVAVNDGFGAIFNNVPHWDNSGANEDMEYMTDDSMFGNAYVGFGYTSPMFGAWLGYQIDALNGVGNTADDSLYIVHTPHLQFTALDNNLRINIPFSIGTYAKKTGEEVTDADTGFNSEGVTAFSTEVQIRYYTPIDYFTAIRLYVRYGMLDMHSAKVNDNITDAQNDALPANQSSFGIEARFYFDVPNDSPVTIAPWIGFTFDTAIGTTEADATATGGRKGQYNKRISALDISAVPNSGTAYSPSSFDVKFNLDLTAGNDFITFLGSPYLLSSSSFGKSVVSTGDAFYNDNGKTTTDLYVGAYMELYVNPVPELQLYVEVDTAFRATATAGAGGTEIIGLNNNFFAVAAGTGVRWYF